MNCALCGQKQGVFAALSADLASGTYVCPECQEAERIQAEKRHQQLKQAASKVIVTTTHGIDGLQIKRYIGIESVEYVIGTGLFSEVTTSVQDLFGARSSAFEQKLQTAKSNALFALKYRAAEKGANAVVGVDLDYSEFSGNRIALIINGTLVEVDGLPPVHATKAASPETVPPSQSPAPSPAPVQNPVEDAWKAYIDWSGVTTHDDVERAKKDAYRRYLTFHGPKVANLAWQADGSVKFTCPCGRPIHAAGSKSGRTIECPACKLHMVVPARTP